MGSYSAHAVCRSSCAGDDGEVQFDVLFQLGPVLGEDRRGGKGDAQPVYSPAEASSEVGESRTLAQNRAAIQVRSTLEPKSLTDFDSRSMSSALIFSF